MILELFLTFFKVGLFTFGGGYAMIPFLQKEAVELHKWVTYEEFVEVIAVDTVAPGPIAVNLATFIGYKVQGVVGSLVATVGVILPSIVLVVFMAMFFYAFRENRLVQSILSTLKPAVVGLIGVTLVFLLKQGSIIDWKTGLIALAVFVAILFFNVHPIIMVVIAALLGVGFYFL